MSAQSPGPSALPPSCSTDSKQPQQRESWQEEHRRLFGFRPRTQPRYQPFSRGGPRNRVGKIKPKTKPQMTWTRKFVCLANTSDCKPPSSSEYFFLKNAGLGEKKVTLNLEYGPSEVDTKLKETFPKLHKSGGYSLMRTLERGSRTLTLLNGPYSTERLKDAVGQGKVFIRPIQCDLSMDVEENSSSIIVRNSPCWAILF